MTAIEAKERARVIDAILAQMSEKRRATLVLFDIEGRSGKEIARMQSLPERTVWTRLRRARKDFTRLIASIASVQDEEEGSLPPHGVPGRRRFASSSEIRQDACALMARRGRSVESWTGHTYTASPALPENGRQSLGWMTITG
jgi:cellulase/cellobiase CelA1